MADQVTLVEGDRDQHVTLELGKQLQRLGVCQVQLTQEGELLASNFSKIGFLRVGDTLVQIRPKVSIRKVLQLLSPSLEHFDITEGQIGITDSEDWTFALVGFFIAACGRALARGPLHGYKLVSEAGNLVKGRIDFSRQLKRSPGRPIPVEIDFDDFVPNIPENQMLLTALERLSTRLPLAHHQKRALQEFRFKLTGVETIPIHQRIPKIEITTVNEHYRSALRMAELIVGFQGMDTQAGDLGSDSFLIDMEKVFEKYVENRFRFLAQDSDFTFRAQGTGESLDRGGFVGIRPDYLWFHGVKAVGIADAKYKAFSSESQVPNSDVYQMVTYCTRYGLRDGFLIYASSPSFTLEIEESPIRVQVRGVDLSEEIQALESHLRSLHKEILLAGATAGIATV